MENQKVKRKTITASVIAQLQEADKGNFQMQSKEVKQNGNKPLPLEIKEHGFQVEVVGQSLKHIAEISNDMSEKSGLRTVELLKSRSEPLGFYIRQGDGFCRKNGVFISRISLGSLVDVNDLLRVGEEILEVNSVSVDGYSLDDVVRLIQIPNRLILTVRSSELAFPPGVMSRGVNTNLFGVEEEQITHAKTKEKSKMDVTYDKQNQHCDYMIKENKNSVKSDWPKLINREPSEKNFFKSSSDLLESADSHLFAPRYNYREPNNNVPRNIDRKTSLANAAISEKSRKGVADLLQKDCEISESHGVARSIFSEREKKNSLTNPSNFTNYDPSNSQMFSTSADSPTNKLSSDLSKLENLSSNYSPLAQTFRPEHEKDHFSHDAAKYKNFMTPNQSPKLPTPRRRRSTLDPETAVNLVYDDELEAKTISVKVDNGSNQLPKNLTLPAKPEDNSISGFQAHHDYNGGIPHVRRLLPSLPGQDMPLDVTTNKSRKTSEDCREDQSSFSFDSLQPEQRTRRMLPTPPSSPKLGKTSQLHVTEKKDYAERVQQKPSTGTDRSSLSELLVPSRAIREQSRSAPVSPKRSYAGMSINYLFDKGNHNQCSGIQSHRSESLYESFLQQQRHSLFLQSYSSGQPSNFNTIRDKKAALSPTSSHPACDNDGVTNQDQNNDKRNLSQNLSKLSTDTHKVLNKSPVSLQVPLRKPIASLDDMSAKVVAKPSLGDCRRISMAALGDKSTLIQVPTIKIERDPGFLIYPDDYNNENLSLSRAVSGMVSFRIMKACDLQLLDKKLLEKKKKLYWAIEVDFERKAFTSWKRSSTKTIQWDEVFDVEIQHGREANLSCYTSHTNFSKPVARATFNFAPFVQCGHVHHVIFKTHPQGLLFVEMEFTEMKTLLKRAPSDRKTGVFGFMLNVTSTHEKSSVPLIVRKCVNEIETRGLAVVGVYRISGNARRKKLLRAEFDDNSSAVDLSEENCPDINVIAGILKDYLRELPEPLITRHMSEALVRAYQDGISDKSFEVKKQLLKSLLRRLPDTNRETLVFLLDHFMKVLDKKEQNKMDSRNLSICLGPVLLCPPVKVSDGKDLLDLKVHMKVVELLLDIWQAAGGVRFSFGKSV